MHNVEVEPKMCSWVFGLCGGDEGGKAWARLVAVVVRGGRRGHNQGHCRCVWSTPGRVGWTSQSILVGTVWLAATGCVVTCTPFDMTRTLCEGHTQRLRCLRGEKGQGS